MMCVCVLLLLAVCCLFGIFKFAFLVERLQGPILNCFVVSVYIYAYTLPHRQTMSVHMHGTAH